MSNDERYEVLVSAESESEAVAIALEGLSSNHEAVRTEARDVSDHQGPGSYLVTIVFRILRGPRGSRGDG